MDRSYQRDKNTPLVYKLCTARVTFSYKLHYHVIDITSVLFFMVIGTVIAPCSNRILHSAQIIASFKTKGVTNAYFNIYLGPRI